MFLAVKQTNSIGHRTNFLAIHPSLRGGGYLRYQLWISINYALTGLLKIACIILKDSVSRNTLKELRNT